MEIQNRLKLLYPSMVIASIAVTVFSLLGIATMTGSLRYAHSVTSSGYGIDEKTEANKEAADGNAAEKISAAACADCGVVESVRAVEVTGHGSGLGAVAGNGIAKNTSYRVRVHMADDSIRTLYQREAPGVSAGDRVKIVDGAVLLQS